MQVAAFELLIFVLLASLASLWRRRVEAYGLPLVAVFVFAFLYVVQPFSLLLDGSLEVFLTPWQLVKALLVAALMLVCFLAGWSEGRTRAPVQASQSAWDPRRLYRAGLGTAIIGLLLKLVFISRSGGLLEFYSKPHGMGAAWTANTAYLYSSPWWILSGTTLMLLASSRMRLKPSQRLPIVALMAVMFLDAVLLSSRGMFFATGSTLLVSLCLARRAHVGVSKALGALVAAGFGVLLLVGYRGVLHLGEEKPAAPRLPEALGATFAVDETHRKLRLTGNEFVYHAAVIDAVDQTQKYHLGLNWIYAVTVHIIPRILWPEKPYGFQTGGITWADIQEYTGIRIDGGAAPGIVADIYAQFGVFSVLFFFLFGKLSRQLMERAMTLSSPLASTAYVMLYALSLNTFAQGFGALIVSYLYSLIPVVLFSLLTKYRRVSVSAAPKAACRSAMGLSRAVEGSHGS